MLMAIWYGSLALAAFSLLIMFYLVIRRVIADMFERRRRGRRERLKHILFDLVSGEISADEAGKKFTPKDQRLVLNVAGQLRRGLRGDADARLVELLNRVVDVQRLQIDLTRGSAADRAGLCAMMSWSQSPEVHRALEERLDDPAPDVVLAAANALVDSGAGISVPALAIKIVRKQMLGHRGVRELLRKVAPHSAKDLKRQLKSKNEQIAVLSADAMAVCNDMSVVADLAEQAVMNPSANVRAECFRSLAELRHPDASDAVMRGLQDPVWEVRTQAAIAAGRIGVSEAVPVLRQRLRDNQWWAQFRSAEALLKLGSPGRYALQAALDDPLSAEVAELVLAEAAV